jgi:hypothetical protein
MTQIWALRSRLEKQPTDRRRRHHYLRDGALGLLGFASVYREGFEVVLLLQGYNLKLGGNIVLGGTLVGLVLSGIVAVLTFIAHRRLP